MHIQCIPRVTTVCLQNVLLKFEKKKNTTYQPLKRKWTGTVYILKAKSNFTLCTTEYIFSVFDFNQIKYCNELLAPVSQFILPPGQLAPRGASCPGISCPPPWLSSPPGGKLSRPVYLAPHPGYLHPRGASCPGRFILPPAQHK